MSVQINITLIKNQDAFQIVNDFLQNNSFVYRFRKANDNEILAHL